MFPNVHTQKGEGLAADSGVTFELCIAKLRRDLHRVRTAKLDVLRWHFSILKISAGLPSPEPNVVHKQPHLGGHLPLFSTYKSNRQCPNVSEPDVNFIYSSNRLVFLCKWVRHKSQLGRAPGLFNKHMRLGDSELQPYCISPKTCEQKKDINSTNKMMDDVNLSM